MKLVFFCPTWGYDQIPFDNFLARVCDSGFVGVETSFPRDSYSEKQIQQRVASIKAHGLELITQHWETITPDFERYKREFETRLWQNVETQPRLINSQTGRDFFEFEQSLELIDIAEKVEKQSGIKILHEIHRGRFSFAAHVTRKFLDARPKLKLTADLSHWCCVAGNMLEDQNEHLQQALVRSEHIHSRVGYSEGPQVPDPSAAEWQETVNIHLNWWMEILENAKAQGKECFSVTTEFGPAPYMPSIPHSNTPTCDQWQANLYVMERLRERYEDSVLI